MLSLKVTFTASLRTIFYAVRSSQYGSPHIFYSKAEPPVKIVIKSSVICRLHEQAFSSWCKYLKKKTEKIAKNSRRECKHYLSFNGILMTYLLGSSLHSVSQYWVLLFSISNVLLDEKSVFFNASIIFNQLEVHIKHVFSNCRTDKSKQFLIICVR